MANRAVRFLSNKTSSNIIANSGITCKRKSFNEVFLLIFIILFLNVLTKFISRTSSYPKCYCTTNEAVRQSDWWIPLATRFWQNHAKRCGANSVTWRLLRRTWWLECFN